MKNSLCITSDTWLYTKELMLICFLKRGPACVLLDDKLWIHGLYRHVLTPYGVGYVDWDYFLSERANLSVVR